MLVSCSLNTLAARAISDSLTGGDQPNPFLSDNDPELIAAALPFTLKLFDSLLQADPENADLWRTTGQTYISYANAFLQTPAQILPPEDVDLQGELLRRAKNLYLRGRDQVLTGIELRHPGFREQLAAGESAALQSRLATMSSEDVPFLYWTAVGWVAAFSTDPFDLELGFSIPSAFALIERALALDAEFGNGAIHEFLIAYYAGLPEGLGGSRELARYHFDQALEVSGGNSPGAYVALAVGISIPEQNSAEFIMLMQRALTIDTDADVENRLLNTIRQRQAQWYLDNAELFFISLDEEIEADSEN